MVKVSKTNLVASSSGCLVLGSDMMELMTAEGVVLRVLMRFAVRWAEVSA